MANLPPARSAYPPLLTYLRICLPTSLLMCRSLLILCYLILFLVSYCTVAFRNNSDSSYIVVVTRLGACPPCSPPPCLLLGAHATTASGLTNAVSTLQTRGMLSSSTHTSANRKFRCRWSARTNFNVSCANVWQTRRWRPTLLDYGRSCGSVQERD